MKQLPRVVPLRVMIVSVLMMTAMVNAYHLPERAGIGLHKTSDPHAASKRTTIIRPLGSGPTNKSMIRLQRRAHRSLAIVPGEAALPLITPLQASVPNDSLKGSSVFRPRQRICPFSAVFGSREMPPAMMANALTSLTTRAPSSSKSSLALSAWEQEWVDRLDLWYREALAIKCPFWRRRKCDFLDGLDMILRTIVIPAERVHMLGPPPSWRCDGDTCAKNLGTTLEELAQIVRRDWRPATGRGYYITGRLTTAVYRDDCLFDGPDPDMPVRGLRKYLNAASQLFEQATSRCELLSLQIDADRQVLVAHWKMHGRLRLPWRPSLPTVCGLTTYHTDHNGLIYMHEEQWTNMSVWRAFVETFFPKLARKLYSVPSSPSS